MQRAYEPQVLPKHQSVEIFKGQINQGRDLKRNAIVQDWREYFGSIQIEMEPPLILLPRKFSMIIMLVIVHGQCQLCKTHSLQTNIPL